FGMVTARSFAMAFNRLVDRHIDARNPRTAARHLPAGTLSVLHVRLFTLGMASLFVASTLLFLLTPEPNWWPLLLSGPVLLFLAGYSLTKRFTSLAHFWLGIALSLAPIAAWIAVCGGEDLLTPLLLAGAVAFWVAGFDILYACQDYAFDVAAGLHSVPVRLGLKGSFRLAAICHAIMLGFLVALGGHHPQLRGIYAAGVVAVAALLIYEHAIIRPDDLRRVNEAFFQVNGVISVGLLATVVLQLAVPI
ncbi:MAG: 4-hydroxybenzoate octaprenyltransferase, partial [Gemmataceae bacterium]